MSQFTMLKHLKNCYTKIKLPAVLRIRITLMRILILFFTIDVDPDPAYHVDADPKPTFLFYADPEPSFQIKAQNLEEGSNRLIFYTNLHFGLSSAN
jgi:hypothetical protein